MAVSSSCDFRCVKESFSDDLIRSLGSLFIRDGIFEHLDPILHSLYGIWRFFNAIRDGIVDIWSFYGADGHFYGCFYGYLIDGKPNEYALHCALKDGFRGSVAVDLFLPLFRDNYSAVPYIYGFIPKTNRCARLFAVREGAENIGTVDYPCGDGVNKVFVFKYHVKER